MSEAAQKNVVDRRRFLQRAISGGLGETGAEETGLGEAGLQRRWQRAAEGAAMRSPRYPQLSDLGEAEGQVPAPNGAAVALNRMGFGPRPGDIDAFNALGGNDTARLQAYVTQQLDPDSISDTELDTKLAAAAFTTLDKSLVELWADHVVADPPYAERMQPLHETEHATFLRAIYSKRQLFEVMVEFWHNHFSVYGHEFNIGPVWVHYDRDVIRPHALGNFRQLLEDNARSTAMLIYLDNYANSADGPNENYARELFELHTLGADAYLGVLPKEDVPLGPGGIPIGFVDEDIFAATRALTGWTVRNRSWDPSIGDTGEFLYYANWHDNDPKHFLSVNIPGSQPDMKDGLDLLDALASHPATARFIATKLCRRLIGDFPPPGVVDAAAAIFAANVSHPQQIKLVVEAILTAPEFLSTWGEKSKRPFEIAVSALRALNGDFNFQLEDGDTGTLMWRYSNTGHELFGWHPPNGYPDIRFAWQSTTPRVMTWRMTNWFADEQDDLDNYRLDAVGQTPAGVRSANDLVDFWVDRIFGRPLEIADRAELVAFMAQGFLPSLDLPLDTDEDTRTRLQSLVGLMFMAPDFLRR